MWICVGQTGDRREVLHASCRDSAICVHLDWILESEIEDGWTTCQNYGTCYVALLCFALPLMWSILLLIERVTSIDGILQTGSKVQKVRSQHEAVSLESRQLDPSAKKKTST